MIARRAAGEQAAGLTDGPGDAHLALGFLVRTAGFKFTHQGIRNPRLQNPQKVRACFKESTGMMPGRIGTDTTAARARSTKRK